MVKKRGLILFFWVLLLIVPINFLGAEVTGNALFSGWGNGSGASFWNSDNFRIFMFFVIFVVIYWVINLMARRMIIGKILFSGLIAYLAVNFITNEQISSIIIVFFILRRLVLGRPKLYHVGRRDYKSKDKF